MEYSRNKKPYQIIVGNNHYLLECPGCEYHKYGNYPIDINGHSLEVGSHEDLLEDVVDRCAFIRKYADFCGGYWDANFFWQEFLDAICDVYGQQHETITYIDNDDGEEWYQVKYVAPWDKIYYYVSYHSDYQGDSGQNLYSTQQEEWTC